MIKRMLFLLCLLVYPVGISFAATHERPMLLRVELHSKNAISLLKSNNFDVTYISKENFAEIVADDADYHKLQSLGLNPSIVHDDLIGFYQSRFPATETMGGFRTYSEVRAYLDSLHTLFPSITTARDSIGLSYQGRAIYMMKISDNPNIDEDEPEFFVNGLIHAREPMGMEATLRFMRYLCDNYGTDPTVNYLVNNREFFFVPVINPDGYEYNRQTNPSGGGMWRKNRRSSGTDLNRNWGYMWGYDDIGSSPNQSDETYRGTAAFSEPETQALRQFIDSRHFSIVMNFHAYADDFLYSWCYADLYTPDEPLIQVIADSVTATNGYVSGTAWEVLYNTNGDANDWQYGEQTEKPKIFGFTIEIGANTDGFWPSPSRIPTLWSEVLPPLLFLARIADNPYAIAAPDAPVLSSIGDIYGNSFTVNWASHDTLNPAVAFELIEMIGYQRLTDDFESGTDNWTLNGFSSNSTRYHSGTTSIFSGSQDNYNVSATAVNPIIVGTGDTLRFWTWYDVEPDYDYIYVQLSTDGGNTYLNLPGNITTTSNPNGANQGNGITGSSGGWIEGIFPLDSYVGRSVTLSLRYRTDGGIFYEGFYADDFYPVDIFQQQNSLGADIPDTSFTVSGRAPGSYYYQVRARDAQHQWSNFSNRVMAIVHPGGGCVYVPGDINGNQVFNGIDITFGVNYLKGIGPNPPDTCNCPPNGLIYSAADANGNCVFNGLDITYSVNYLKGFGNAPLGCPDCPPARR
jgi:hypothetical protein